MQKKMRRFSTLRSFQLTLSSESDLSYNGFSTMSQLFKAVLTSVQHIICLQIYNRSIDMAANGPWNT